jgi:DNA-binding MarR family transcriptional regulator
MFSSDVNRLLQSYPKIYLACHRRHVRDDERGRSLSAHLAGILDHLDRADAITVSELALHLDVTESTVSIQIRKLEREGYVRRIRDPQDGRRVRLHLTAAGVRVKQQNSVLDPDLARRMISLLPAKDAEGALSGLELLAQAAEKLMRHRQLRRRRKGK